MKKDINPNDIKALQFREDLIKLCKKYNCELSGSCKDDGNINLEICDKGNGWTSQYEIKDAYSNYLVYKEDKNYNKVCIMDESINNAFDRESSEMAGLNNVKVSCGILTMDPEKAELKLKELYYNFGGALVERFITSKDRKDLLLKNSERYIWIKPDLSSRGYRCGKIILDRNITLEQLYEIVMPMCYACGRDDVKIF
jgi:ribosomal protein L31